MSDISSAAHAKRKEQEKKVKQLKKVKEYWATTGAAELKKGNPQKFKELFADDDSSEHILDLLAALTNSTWGLGGLVYPQIDLSKLRDQGYGKLVDYMLENFTRGMGIRPDTPFHANNEGKYPASVDAPYRYMELSALGGGMRLVFDSTASALFITAHYAIPMRLVASKAPDAAPLAGVVTALAGTQGRLATATEGTVDRDALSDPLFRAYVLHPRNHWMPGLYGFSKTEETKTPAPPP